MDAKLNHSELSAMLAKVAGLSNAKAEAFTKAFFDIIIEGLENDGSVKINGLGTFKITDVASRESVNVNTGEKFEIKGHKKLTFTPADALKEKVNQPFAMFEPVEIDDSYVEEEENEEPVEEYGSAEPQKPLGKMSKYMEEFDSENLLDAITDELYGETKYGSTLVRSMVSNNMESTMAMLQECAEKFDSAEQPDNVTMDEISLKVFDQADKLATIFMLKNTQRLVMAQKIANAIMRLASPVALDEETYGKYADS